MTAALHQLSQDVYSRTQAAGGLRLFRLRAIMLEYRADLHRLTTQAHSLFADIKRDAKSYFPTARGGASAAAGVPAPVAVRGGPRKKKQRHRVFRELPRPALRPQKGYRHARRVRKELGLDLSSFVKLPLGFI
jgi:hypothetical protein